MVIVDKSYHYCPKTEIADKKFPFFGILITLKNWTKTFSHWMTILPSFLQDEQNVTGIKLGRKYIKTCFCIFGRNP